MENKWIIYHPDTHGSDSNSYAEGRFSGNTDIILAIRRLADGEAELYYRYRIFPFEISR